MKTTVDAFGAEVIVGEFVVFKGQHKCLEKGLVIKCTPHGATVACGIHKTNVRSERICKILNGQQRLGVDTPVLDRYNSPFPYYTSEQQQVLQ